MTAGRSTAARRAAGLSGKRSAGGGAAAFTPQGCPGGRRSSAGRAAASVALSLTLIPGGLPSGSCWGLASARWP